MKSINNFMTTLAILALVFSQNAFAGPAGRVTYIEGRVDRVTAGGDNYVPVVVGDEISTGDSLRTKSYSKAEVTFDDDSIVRVGDSSKVTVKEYVVGEDGLRKKAVIDLDRGKLRAIVSKTVDLVPFDINTPNAAGFVKGSDIFVTFLQSATNVLVSEGVFHMENPSFPGDSIAVTEGMTSKVPYNGPPEEARAFLPMEKDNYENVTGPTFFKDENAAGSSVYTKALVSKISGAVRVLPVGSKKWHAPIKDEVLNIGDRIETGDEGRLLITFDNGLSMELLANTQLIITKLTKDPKSGDYDNEFESGYGKIIANLQNKPDSSKFIVKTPNAACGIRGTIMYLHIKDGNDCTRVFFDGGNGYMTPSKDKLKRIIGLGLTGTVCGEGETFSLNPTTDIEREMFSSDWGNEGQNEYGYSSPGDEVDYGDVGEGPADPGTPPAPRDLGNEPFDDVKPDLDTPEDSGDGGETGDEPEPGINGSAELNYGYYGSFAIDSESFISASLNSDEISSPWNGIYPVTFSGFYSNPGSRDLFFGDNGNYLTGVSGDGGSFIGYFVGSNRPVPAGSDWEGLLAAIYIDPSNTTGTMTSDLLGNYGPGGVMTASGNIKYTPMGSFDLTPEEILLDVSPDTTGEFMVLIDNNTGYFVAPEGNMTRRSMNINGENWGVWEAIYKGGYQGPGTPGWTGMSGGQMDDGGYFYTQVTGADDLNGFIRLDTLRTSLTRMYLGEETGIIVGTYDEAANSFESVGAGVWENTPLAFMSDPAGSLYVVRAAQVVRAADDMTYLENAGDMEGILGGTGSIWSNESVDVTFMGTWDWTSESDYNSELMTWGCELVSRNDIQESDITYEEDPGAYRGFIGGYLKNPAEAFIRALYASPSGEIGYIAGHLDEGSLYSDFDLFVITGTMGRNPVETDLEISVEDFSANPWDYIHEGSISAKLSGHFNYESGGAIGNISGEEQLEGLTTLAFNGETWGVFDLFGLSGTFSGGTRVWEAVIGGAGEFGTVLWQGETPYYAPDNGYYIADINNGSVDLLYTLRGTLDGWFISHLKMGPFTGELVGGATRGLLWQSVVLGEWIGDELAWGAAWGYEGGPSSIYRYNGEGFSWTGEDWGLIGSWDSLENGYAEFKAGGEFYLTDDSGASCVWLTPVFSHTVTDSAYFEYFEGAFQGRTVGVVSSDSMRGLIVALFVDPNNGAGFLEATLDGDILSDIEMWRAGGEIAAYDVLDSIGFGPQDLTENLISSSIEGNGDMQFDDGASWFTPDMHNGETLLFQGTNWGVWSCAIGGEFYLEKPGGVLPSTSNNILFSGTLGNGSIYLPYAAVLCMDPEGGNIFTDLNAVHEGDFRGIWINTSFNGEAFVYDAVSVDEITTQGTSWGMILGKGILVIEESGSEFVEIGEEISIVDSINGIASGVAAGEWVEVEELVDLVDIVSEMSDIMDAFDSVSMPITDVMGLTGIGSGGIDSASMDISLYSLADLNIWTALISGTYDVNSSPSGNGWGIDFDDVPTGASIDVNGVEWANGEWLANVSGAIDGNILDGMAAGTYGDGNFEGAGAGTWTQQAD